MTHAAGHGLARTIATGGVRADAVELMATETGLPDELADSLVDELLALWRKAGVFDPAPEQRAIPQTKVRDRGTGLRISLSSGNVAITSDSKKFEAELAHLLAPLGATRHAGPKEAAETSLHVAAIGQEFVVTRDGRAVWTPCNHDEARFLVLRAIAAILPGRDRVGTVLHAGAVAGREGAIVLSGSSGSGKTTLVASLVAAGYSYMSDDHVPIAVKGDAAFAFPTLLGLKVGSVALPELASLIETSRAPGRGLRDGVTFLRMPFHGSTERAVPISAVVLPRFDPKGPNEVTVLPFEIALREILLAGAEVARDADVLPALAGLVDRRPVIRLRYNGTAAGVSACQELLQCNRT